MRRITTVLALLACFTVPMEGTAANLRPFVLAYQADGGLDGAAAAVKEKLKKANFQVAGSYRPYAGTEVIAVTSDALKAAAAKSDFGSFGAVMRVTVTESSGKVQVAYTNPVYASNAYHMADDLTTVADTLGKALGQEKDFGSESGLSPEQLRKYHYKFLMPFFDDRIELARHASYEAAVAEVEKGLAAKAGGVGKVYRVDIPGKEESVFGVQMSKECSADDYIMKRIDFKEVRSTGHLPYEVVVSGKSVYTLPAEFRIAINFPDLSMMGDNSFASIMCAPGAIKDSLIQAAGG